MVSGYVSGQLLEISNRAVEPTKECFGTDENAEGELGCNYGFIGAKFEILGCDACCLYGSQAARFSTTRAGQLDDIVPEGYRIRDTRVEDDD